jgi:hypothetical protein
MQDNRKQVWGRRTDDQMASSTTKIKKNGKSMNKRLARRTMAKSCSATSRPPLSFLPELFKFLQFAFCFELNKDALLKCPDNVKDKVSHVYALRNIYCFWDDQNEVRIMITIFLLSCLWRVLYSKIISYVSPL